MQRPATAPPPGSDATPEPAATGPVTAATDRLLRTAESFDDVAMRAPSKCPGWTRAHVLTHVARNADGLTNLLTWARTGVRTPQYPSREARAADIEDGSQRSAAEIVDDVRASAQRFSASVASLPDEAWERQVQMGPAATGRTIPARRVLWRRLREVEIHHVDLEAGYTPEHWSPAFVARALADTYRDFGRRDDVPAMTLVVEGGSERLGGGGAITVSGTAPAMLAWLSGRSDGSDLDVQPSGPLPVLPPWA